MRSGRRPPPIRILDDKGTPPAIVNTNQGLSHDHKEKFSLFSLMFDGARFRQTREALAFMKEASTMFKDVRDRLDPDARAAFEVRLQQLKQQARSLHQTDRRWPKFLYLYFINPLHFKTASLRLREEIHLSSNTLDSPVQPDSPSPFFSYVERRASPSLSPSPPLVLFKDLYHAPPTPDERTFTQGMAPLDTEAVTQSRAIRMLNTLFATAEHECPSTSILDDSSSCVNQAMAGPSNFTTDVGCHEKERESDDSGASFVTAANSVSSSAGQ